MPAMTVQEIYEKYGIMRDLQLHQLRVAAVGKTVAEHAKREVDTEAVTLSGLFHDMGNIIKADLTRFPEFIPPSEVPKWQRVKDEWIAKYGPDEHHATIEIGREIGLSERVLILMDGTRFSQVPDIVTTGARELQILEYSDLRVGPHGIVSLTERLQEGHDRYADKKGYNTDEGKVRYEKSERASYELEKVVFESLTIKPEDITEESLKETVESLRGYQIP